MNLPPNLKGKCKEMAKFYRNLGHPYLEDAEKYEELERNTSKRLRNSLKILFWYYVEYPLEKYLSNISGELVDAFSLWTSLELTDDTKVYKEVREIRGVGETEVFKAVRAVEERRTS